MPPAPMPTLTCWPAAPSKTISAILPTALIVALTVAPPIEARPVNATLAAVFGAGGTKKSSALCVAPPGVESDSRPEVAPPGTGTEMFVAVADVIGAGTMLNRRRLLVGVGSKLLPVIETFVPGVPIVGAKLVMEGAPLEVVTVKGALLVADPAGEVTAIAPVVAPRGTVATSSVGLADVIAAAVPLKVTVFAPGVESNPVPKIVTTVPAGPAAGLKSMIETSAELCREMLVRLPTAS